MRVGLRCLPFRKAPKIIEVLANESVFYYEGVQSSVEARVIPTDEREYAYAGESQMVVGFADPTNESTFPYDEAVDSVVDAENLETTSVQVTLDFSRMAYDMYTPGQVSAYREGLLYTAATGRPEGDPVGPHELSRPTVYGTLSPRTPVVVIPEWVESPPSAYPFLGQMRWEELSAIPTGAPISQTSIQTITHPLGVPVQRPVVRLQRSYSTSVAGQRLGILWNEESAQSKIAVPGVLLDDASNAALSLANRTTLNTAGADMILGVKRDVFTRPGTYYLGETYHRVPPCGQGGSGALPMYLDGQTRILGGLVWRSPFFGYESYIGFTVLGQTVFAPLHQLYHITGYDEANNTVCAPDVGEIAQLEAAINAVPGVADAGGVTIDILRVLQDGSFRFMYH